MLQLHCAQKVHKYLQNMFLTFSVVIKTFSTFSHKFIQFTGTIPKVHITISLIHPTSITNCNKGNKAVSQHKTKHLQQKKSSLFYYQISFTITKHNSNKLSMKTPKILYFYNLYSEKIFKIKTLTTKKYPQMLLITKKMLKHKNFFFVSEG